MGKKDHKIEVNYTNKIDVFLYGLIHTVNQDTYSTVLSSQFKVVYF